MSVAHRPGPSCRLLVLDIKNRTATMPIFAFSMPMEVNTSERSCKRSNHKCTNCVSSRGTNLEIGGDVNIIQSHRNSCEFPRIHQLEIPGENSREF